MTKTPQHHVPKLRFPEFEEEWEEYLLEDKVTNKSQKCNLSTSENKKVIELDSIEQNTGRLIKTYDSKDLKSTKNVFEKNQVLYSKLRPYLNKYYYTDFEGLCSSEIWVLKAKNKDTSNRFVYSFIQTNRFSKAANVSAGSKMPRAEWDSVKNTILFIPNYTEQEKIGMFFNKLDRQIELEEKKLELLEQQKKGYMQKIFSQKLRFKDENGNEYPEWEDVKLQNIANIKKGEQIKKENIDNNGKYYHLNGGTTASSRTNLFNTNPFTISISEGGNSCGFIKMNKEYFFSGGHNYTLLDLSVSNFYLYAYLKYHEKKIMSLRVGSGLPNIQKKDISNYLIKIPRKEEQEKIGSFFKNLDEFIEKQVSKIELLKQRKQGLLQKMFV
ncbi:restriction endonuclease subunit S [Staphylococcus chromogenes]|uniref:restriction endonuclease subunit S n=1 Tax=Staphylococcus chromogenes TaxID=46126 RepID=UPI000D1A6A81|nr:restriction endonuclease subunit S [Staphylococcus chromogenes]PTG10689.1 restriction endonuclease subunit S [Staphylococcus chromogenes]